MQKGNFIYIYDMIKWKSNLEKYTISIKVQIIQSFGN